MTSSPSTDAFPEVILQIATGAKFIRLTVPPAVGGVSLATKAAGLSPHRNRELLINSRRN